MDSNTKRYFLIGGLALVIVLAGAGIWNQFFRDTAPPPASLEAAVQSIQQPTQTATTAVAPTATTAATTTSVAEPTTGATVVAEPTATEAAATETPVAEPTATETVSTLGGTWVITDNADLFVGYRIGEVLVSIGTTEAVGRTSDVQGSGVIEGATLISASFEADMTTLTSDDSRRDGQLRNQALQTNQFPTATFELTGPVELPANLAEGEATSVDVTGTLTLHGVSNEVTISLQMQLVGDVLVAAGNIEITLADYDISPPTAGSVVSVEETGLMEVQLFFVRG